MRKKPTYEELERRLKELEAGQNPQTVEALRESEELYRTLLETSPDSIVMYSLGGEILAASIQAARLYGVSTVAEFRAEVKTAFDLLTEESREVAAANFHRTLIEGYSNKNEYQVCLRNGKIISVEINSSLLRTASGEPRAFISVIRDITDRKRAEENLRESEKKFRDIAELAPQIIYELDTKGRLLFINKEAMNIFGLTQEDLRKGIDVLGLFPPDEQSKVRHNLKYMMEGGSTHGNEYRMIRKDGIIFPVVAYSAPIFKDGKLEGFRGVLTDVTGLKRAEDEALHRSKELTALNRLARLVTAQYSIEEASRLAIEELAASVVPDLGLLFAYEEGDLNLKASIPPSLSGNFATVSLHKVGECLCGLAAKTGQPIYCLDVNTDPRCTWSECKAAGMRSFAAVPMRLGDVLVGVIGLGSKIHRDFEQSARFLETATDQIATSIHNAQLYNQIRSYATQLEQQIADRKGAEIKLRSAYEQLAAAEGQLRAQYDSLVESEQALRESEERFKTLFDKSAVAQLLLNDEGKIVDGNDAYLELFALQSKAEVLDRSFIDFTPEFQPDGTLSFNIGNSLLTGVLKKGVAVTEWHQYKHDSAGTPIVTEMISTLIPIAAHPMIHIALHDITKRKQAEEQRENLMRQLQQSQKMEAIGTLAGGIAHDFNNILSAIIGYTDMALAHHTTDDHIRRYLNQVYKGGERARDLVKQILTFSRQSSENLSPLRISPIVKEVLKLLRASLPSTIKLHHTIQSEQDTVFADPTQIHQVLMNLCTNSAHAMRERKGELKVGLASVEIQARSALVSRHGLTPGMYLKMTVSDTGHGIAPDIMSRIFDPFFTTKEAGEGTGMGLSVVHGIVKSYRGAITVESTVGKGTEFNVYLPLLMDTEDKKVAETALNIRGGKERILFVDDEENLVHLGRDVLTDLGYEVTGRISSMDALELFQSQPERFDLVITDMTMPNMTGSEFAQEIMRIRPDMPVILCTGFSETITPEKARIIGVKEFIMKPVVRHQLAAAIRRAMDRKE